MEQCIKTSDEEPGPEAMMWCGIADENAFDLCSLNLFSSTRVLTVLRVEKYSFGEIVVNGKTYTRDLIITPSRIVPNWWRREGHELCLDDIREVLEEDIEVLVIGTGYSGLMRVLPEVYEAAEKKGIRVIAEKSAEACKIYNRLLSKGRRVALAIHLTC